MFKLKRIIRFLTESGSRLRYQSSRTHQTRRRSHWKVFLNQFMGTQWKTPSQSPSTKRSSLNTLASISSPRSIKSSPFWLPKTLSKTSRLNCWAQGGTIRRSKRKTTRSRRKVWKRSPSTSCRTWHRVRLGGSSLQTHLWLWSSGSLPKSLVSSRLACRSRTPLA